MANPTNNSYSGIIDWVKASNNDVIAKSAAKLTTGRTLTIADSDGTNSTAAASVPTFDGSANVTLKLPATIKASITGNVTGNCSGSSGSCTGNAASATKVTIAQDVAAKWRPILMATDNAVATKQAPLISGNQKATNAAVTDIALRAHTAANATAVSQDKRVSLCIGNGLSYTDTTDDSYKYAKAGQLYMYGLGKGYTLIKPGYNSDSSITITLPSATGTLARTSDNITGSAAKLTTARSITLSGAVTGTASFDGSANVTISTTLMTIPVGEPNNSTVGSIWIEN